jgi:hypothetical protein
VSARPSILRLWRQRRFTALLVAALLPAAGCSEKPAGGMVWKQDLLGIKTAVTGVVAFATHDAIAVGWALPEFALIAQPLSLHWTGSAWTPLPMPTTRSTVVLGAAPDRDHSVWAVGRIVSSEAEPFDPVPVVYRYAAGAWTSLPLDELGQQNGVALLGVATSGSGTDLEARAVGDSVSDAGRVFRYASGHWSVMPTPVPPPGVSWTLRAISYSAATRTWYAAGRGAGSGGTILIDRGAGWESVVGPPIAVEWTGVAFDGRGLPYLAGNRIEGASQLGVVYRLQLARWVEVPITRRTGGAFHLWAIGFDAAGNGWSVGGREAGGPFFAGTSPRGWTESAVEAEVEEHPETEEVAAGELTGVAVLEEQVAFAVGSAQEADPEGGSEYQPRVFRLVFRPVGEVDLPTTPVH